MSIKSVDRSGGMYTPRQDLVERVHGLPEASQRHVFHVLRKKDIKYTENGNGVFFNLTNCQDPEVWDTLQRIVDQQTTMQRENVERENRIREMQDVLRYGDRPGSSAAEASEKITASVAASLAEVVPAASAPPPAGETVAAKPSPPPVRSTTSTSSTAKKTPAKGGAAAAAAKPTPRDILSMLAK